MKLLLVLAALAALVPLPAAASPRAGHCDVYAGTPKLFPRDNHQVYSLLGVDCDDGAFIRNGSVTGRLFWTECAYHDGTHCDLNSNTGPKNWQVIDTCGQCEGLNVQPQMWGRRGVCRFYWAHGVFRADNWWPYGGQPGDPIGFWSIGPRLCVPK